MHLIPSLFEKNSVKKFFRPGERTLTRDEDHKMSLFVATKHSPAVSQSQCE